MEATSRYNRVALISAGLLGIAKSEKKQKAINIPEEGNNVAKQDIKFRARPFFGSAHAVAAKFRDKYTSSTLAVYENEIIAWVEGKTRSTFLWPSFAGQQHLSSFAELLGIKPITSGTINTRRVNVGNKSRLLSFSLPEYSQLGFLSFCLVPYLHT